MAGPETRLTKVGAMTAPQPRPNVLAIPAYVAGKPPVARPGLTSYKLSSNENPYPPLPGVLEAAHAAAAEMNRYPDMGSAALYAALGEAIGVPVEDLAAATGSVALIYQLVNAFCDPGDEVVYAWRSFEAYPIAVTAGGATSVQVPLRADGRHDLDAMAAAVTDRTKVVIVCTPNNPTGPAVTQTELDAFIARSRPTWSSWWTRPTSSSCGWTTRSTASRPTARHANVVLTRTFSKAYGLAGFRVGYAVAPAPLAAALRAVSLPFGVSHVAQAAAIASLAAQDELFARVDDLVARRADLVARLREVGWELPDAQGNFVWFPLGDRAPRLRRGLRGGRDLGAALRRRRRTRQHRRGRGLRPRGRGGRPLRAWRVIGDPRLTGILTLSGGAPADNLRESLTTPDGVRLSRRSRRTPARPARGPSSGTTAPASAPSW